jgi:hypothetical protein
MTKGNEIIAVPEDKVNEFHKPYQLKGVFWTPTMTPSE